MKRATHTKRSSSKHVNLTGMQEAFCVKFFETGNASEAYRHAYPGSKKWKEAVVNVKASIMLTNGRIKVRLTELDQLVRKDTEITVERIKQEWAKIGFSDMKDFAEWGPGGVKLIESKKLGDKTRCVVEVSESSFKGERTIKFKLHDKVAALTNLAKHMGMFVESDGAALAQGALALDAFREMVKAANTVVIPPAIGRGNGHA